MARLSDPETGVVRGVPRTAICVQDVDVQCVLQFTLIHAAGCALHRRTSRVIHRIELCSTNLPFSGADARKDSSRQVGGSARRRQRSLQAESPSRRPEGVSHVLNVTESFGMKFGVPEGAPGAAPRRSNPEEGRVHPSVLQVAACKRPPSTV